MRGKFAEKSIIKYLAIILVCAVILISGCGQITTGDSSTTDNPGYSDSAPAKMLEAPKKARNKADKASEKVQDALDAIEGINTAP